MRTTLNIDKDVLDAAKEIARKQNTSTGQIVSQLLRKVLTGQTGNLATTQGMKLKSPSVSVFRPFPAGKTVVTNDTVNRLRETEAVSDAGPFTGFGTSTCTKIWSPKKG